MRLDWLADVLRDAGCAVYEMSGWRDRGKDLVSVEGVVWHHTASTDHTSDLAMERILRDGRRDLPGPLAQLGLRRDGTWVTVAAGRANHNGYGTWGNQSIGIEAYNDGVGEPWPTAQIDSWVVGTAAICHRLGLPASRVLGHRETDPKRKIDPRGLDMGVMRGRVESTIRLFNTNPTTPTTPTQPTTPTTPTQPTPTTIDEDDMGFLIIEGVGIFAKVGSVLIGYPDLASYARDKERSPGAPTMTISGKTATDMWPWLLRQMAAAAPA